MKLILLKAAASKGETLRAIRKAVYFCTDQLPSLAEALASWATVKDGGAAVLAEGISEELAEKGHKALTEKGCEATIEDEPDAIIEDDELDYVDEGAKLALFLIMVAEPAQALQLCQAFRAITGDDRWTSASSHILATFTSHDAD